MTQTMRLMGQQLQDTAELLESHGNAFDRAQGLDPALTILGRQLHLARHQVEDACAIGDLFLRANPTFESHLRPGKWLNTASGKQYWPLDPHPREIHTADLVKGLCRPRFNNQVRVDYCPSIIAHSLRVCAIVKLLLERAIDLRHVDKKIALAYGLVHDGNEAYLPDMPRPLKEYLPGWSRIEMANQRAVHLRYGLDADAPDEIAALVKDADNIALAWEARVFCAEPSTEEGYSIFGMPDDIVCHPDLRDFAPGVLEHRPFEEQIEEFESNLRALVPNPGDYVAPVPAGAEQVGEDDDGTPLYRRQAPAPVAPSTTKGYLTEGANLVDDARSDAIRARNEARLRDEGAL